MADQSEVKVTPIEASQIKKGKYVMLKGKPCKVSDVKTSKTGKHGHMKVNITGVDVLYGKKYNDVMPGHANCLEFKYDKREYQLLDLHEGSIECLDPTNNKTETFNLDPEQEITEKLKADYEAGKSLLVSIVRAPVELGSDKFKDEEVVESYKEDKEGGDK